MSGICLSDPIATELNLNMTTANFLLSFHIPHLNCRPDPSCLTFLDLVSQPKSPFINLSFAADCCQCLLGSVRLWPSLTGLSHTIDCISLCAVCSDSQTSRWRRDKCLFYVALFYSAAVCFAFVQFFQKA